MTMEVLKYEKYEIEPSCAYCLKGGCGEKCEQRAEQKNRYCCRNFRYDPLKRVPSRPVAPVKPPEGSFSL